MISRAVEHTIAIQGQKVAEELESILFPDGAPEKLSTASFVEALATTLARVGHELEQADLTHANELADDDGYRQQREKAREGLTGALLRGRSMLEGSHGPEAVARVDLAAPLPKNNQKLITHARHVAAQLTVAS